MVQVCSPQSGSTAEHLPAMQTRPGAQVTPSQGSVLRLLEPAQAAESAATSKTNAALPLLR